MEYVKPVIKFNNAKLILFLIFVISQNLLYSMGSKPIENYQNQLKEEFFNKDDTLDFYINSMLPNNQKPLPLNANLYLANNPFYRAQNENFKKLENTKITNSDLENLENMAKEAKQRKYAACGGKKFSINSSDAENAPRLIDLLDGVASSCDFSLIVSNDAKEVMQKQMEFLHIKDLSFLEVLDVLLAKNALNFKIDKNTITINRVITKTFNINYVSTKRTSNSLTDVLFAQDNAEDGTDAKLGKSGTTLETRDSLDFFSTLKLELEEILDTNDITINPQAGLITITGQIDLIAKASKYLNALSSKMRQEVLIEVNILSLKYSKGNNVGINWSNLFQTNFSFDVSPIANSINVIGNNIAIGDIVKFLNSYGKVTSISNPKILTLNNQPALISVGNILRYKLQKTLQSSNSNTTIQNTNDQYPSIFAGILLDVTPSICRDEIILKINPSVTKTKDLQISNEAKALDSPPNLSTSQLSSIVRLHNGERVILGGLISNNEFIVNYRLPILGYIPLLDTLFAFKSKKLHKEEVIIVITPHIVPAREARLGSMEL